MFTCEKKIFINLGAQGSTFSKKVSRFVFLTLDRLNEATENFSRSGEDHTLILNLILYKLQNKYGIFRIEMLEATEIRRKL